MTVNDRTASISYTCSQAQNLTLTCCLVWDENGQDDIKWYEAPSTTTNTDIDLSNHPGYGTFIPQSDLYGKLIGLE